MITCSGGTNIANGPELDNACALLYPKHFYRTPGVVTDVHWHADANADVALGQTDGARILVFPAFLRGIDVDFQLHVPGHGPAHPPAVLRVVAVANEVAVWATPSSRQKDVVLLAPQ